MYKYKRMGSELLTPEQVKIAKGNGIKYMTLYCRVVNWNWDVERAISEPVQSPQGKPSKYYTREQRLRAAANGINYDTLRHRLKRGWTMEEAINTPLVWRGEKIVHVTR